MGVGGTGIGVEAGSRQGLPKAEGGKEAASQATPFGAVKFPLKPGKDFSSLSSKAGTNLPLVCPRSDKGMETAGRWRGNAFVKETSQSELLKEVFQVQPSQPLGICLGGVGHTSPDGQVGANPEVSL